LNWTVRRSITDTAVPHSRRAQCVLMLLELMDVVQYQRTEKSSTLNTDIVSFRNTIKPKSCCSLLHQLIMSPEQCRMNDRKCSVTLQNINNDQINNIQDSVNRLQKCVYNCLTCFTTWGSCWKMWLWLMYSLQDNDLNRESHFALSHMLQCSESVYSAVSLTLHDWEQNRTQSSSSHKTKEQQWTQSPSSSGLSHCLFKVNVSTTFHIIIL